MAYEFRQLRRQKVRYNDANDDNVLRAALVVDGAKVTPTSATITIYAPGNSTAILASTAMTVSGTLLTYAVSTTTTATWPVGTGYRADIVVTASGTTYPGHILFDVVKYLLRSTLTNEQMLDGDDGIRSADWAGDDDLSGLIEATRDELQLLLEGVATESTRVLEDMALDHHKFSVCHRRYALANFWRARGETEKADHHLERFKTLWKAFIASCSFDTGQSGSETSEKGRIVYQRLVT